MVQTEMQDYYNIPLGNTKLTNYNFVFDYGRLDLFNASEDEEIRTNISSDADGYYLTQGIIESNRSSILSCTEDYRVRIFYDVILFNIERNINVLEVARMLNIQDAEHQLNRLKAIVHMHHLGYYCKLNDILLEFKSKPKAKEVLENIAIQNESKQPGILKMLLSRIQPRHKFVSEVHDE